MDTAKTASTRAFSLARRVALGVALLFALSAPALGPSVAAAAGSVEVTIHVQNESGRDQVNTAVAFSDGFVDYTDQYGELSVRVSAGETFRVHRGRSVPTSCQAPPEGWSGRSQTVPAGVVEGQTIEVTLPDIVSAQHFQPASSAERGFVGVLNERRSSSGRSTLRVSEPLMAQAQMYALALDAQRGSLKPCHSYPHISLISSDLGFSSVLGSEGMYATQGSAGSAEAVEYFTTNNSDLMMSRSANAIGVASSGGTWVVVLAAVSDPCDRPACELTSDVGDPSLGGAPGGGGAPTARAAQISLRKAALKGGKVQLAFKVRNARGKVRATITRGGSPKRLRVRGGGSSRKAVTRAKRGRWEVSARATGTNGHTTQRCWKLRVKKRGVKVSSARC